ncbi:MAG: hypothetical protein A2174_01650 [Candidatus Portnoybacteria bacterium RBG_13_41_18]|uniref:Uncharacterized protein n=1 Tax=Candidatus Portnoybacteria bacterium RBG_13_41_18 TaxID=1801991 RepID=A0A1G2FAR7_9BACT|nr:MAG: hypothetical protein A2174_01650 [Candidatus Portnoybacteria bacterium RBG_13_41_18]
MRFGVGEEEILRRVNALGLKTNKLNNILYSNDFNVYKVVEVKGNPHSDRQPLFKVGDKITEEDFKGLIPEATSVIFIRMSDLEIKGKQPLRYWSSSVKAEKMTA